MRWKQIGEDEISVFEGSFCVGGEEVEEGGVGRGGEGFSYEGGGGPALKTML